ncbi:Enoyl-CoA hydratase, mitochondrial [Hondaea fermentalgiana]|uniref:Enoyl-CoA hydratase, mitochondrial n=1 Tax=Hondaea fermentalgiana TaxID=2315210 RepID=A0A2R5GH70_9STRA|nr:Enoyl-CoA hydratase, mitochondrial [Hondaea fermentalgiana]|eukprot:GBG30256.1 Enoyl-CoA hydratase, mitochondrial [Hondaea fermentalgiana]
MSVLLAAWLAGLFSMMGASSLVFAKTSSSLRQQNNAFTVKKVERRLPVNAHHHHHHHHHHCTPNAKPLDVGLFVAKGGMGLQPSNPGNHSAPTQRSKEDEHHRCCRRAGGKRGEVKREKMAKYETIIVERDARGWDVVTLNRPERLNAANPKLMSELLAYLSDLETDELVTHERDGPKPRAILLKASGRAFCAGLDLVDGETLGGEPPHGTYFFNAQRKFSQIILVMRRIKQPIVALLQGPAAGFGLALALAADVRIIQKNFKCNVAMAKIGFTGGDLGISYFLPRIVGPTVAGEMMMTGRFLEADRAYQLGFASSIHDTYDEVLKAGEALVSDMIETMAPMPLFLTKEALNLSLAAPSLHSQIALEDRQQLMALKDPAFAVYVKKGFKKSKI